MYRFSRANYVIVFYLVRYRRNVVSENIIKAFPHLTSKEHKTLIKSFYKNFSDIFHEVLFYRKFGKDQLMNRIKYKNPDLIKKYVDNNRSVLVVAGHYGNWELLGLTLPLITGCKTLGVAKPQKDPFFNQEINKIRGRMGLDIIPVKKAYRTLLHLNDEPTVSLFVSDQAPPKSEIEFWTLFLNQQTPVFLGPERIAKALGLVVIFAEMSRTSKGNYIVDFSLVSDDPANEPNNTITKKHVKLLENAIKKQPDNWLWSHRRWKHKPERFLVNPCC